MAVTVETNGFPSETGTSLKKRPIQFFLNKKSTSFHALLVSRDVEPLEMMESLTSSFIRCLPPVEEL